MKFELGEICILQNLTNPKLTELNGEECTVHGFLHAGQIVDSVQGPMIICKDGYTVQTSTGIHGVSEDNLRKPPSADDQSVDQIWNDLIHRLTEGVPA